MRLHIHHKTVYRYETAARYSVQSLRLTPQSYDAQTVHSWSIQAPGIETAGRFVDGFGNDVHLATACGEHDSVEIVVEGDVETHDRAGIVSGVRETFPRFIYLRSTKLTEANDDISDLVGSIEGRDRLDRLHGLMREIRSCMDYEPGETHSGTTASEAFAKGAGVCQDHTHVFLSGARLLGVPARYVSGYLYGYGTEQTQAQHSWAEAYIEDLGWVGFDVANNVCPTEHYVRVASGLDYRSAAPVRGARVGGGTETLGVVVAVDEAGASEGEAQSQSQTQSGSQSESGSQSQSQSQSKSKGSKKARSKGGSEKDS